MSDILNLVQRKINDTTLEYAPHITNISKRMLWKYAFTYWAHI